MKKLNLITLSILSLPVFATDFVIIVDEKTNNYAVGGFTDSKDDPAWTVASTSCSFDKETSEFYYGVDFLQTESCTENLERTVTTTRTYENGETEVISTKKETDTNVLASTSETVQGTHLENSCYAIKENGWSSGDGVYRISNNYDVYCDQTTDGGGWTLVFNHDISGGYFSSDTETLYNNISEPSLNTAKYSILNTLEHFRRNGKLEFKIAWKGFSAKNIWRQTSNPTVSLVSGYEAISIASTSNYWGGLERSTTTSATFIDGSVNHSNWFYSVGSKVAWGSSNVGIPAATDITPVSSYGVPNINLWIR